MVLFEEEREHALLHCLELNIHRTGIPEWILESKHGRSVSADCSGHWLRFHDSRVETSSLHSIPPFPNLVILEYDLSDL